MAYIGPHNHSDQGSNLRLRDSTNKIADIIEYAHGLGHKGIFITEHESISSHIAALKYYNSKKNLPGWEGFKLGLGNEIYLCNESVNAGNIGHNAYPHFILLALDELGHKGIRELSTKAWLNNSFMHVMYRIPTYYGDLEEMLDKYRGHVMGASACLGGALPRRLLQYQQTPTEDIWESCIGWIEYMNEIFGKGYFFLEMQPSDNAEQIYVNNKLVELSCITDTPYLISTDAHYLKKEDRYVHEIYLKAEDGDREVDEFYATTYIMSEEEIHDYMDKYLGDKVVQKGIDNTMLIYDKLQSYELAKKLEIPYIPLTNENPDQSLYKKYGESIPLLKEFLDSPHDCDRHLVREVLRYIDTDPYYQTELAFEKINECLSYISVSSEKMSVRWSAYLLQVADYVRIAWESGTLVGAGRGSGVGFCLLNILGITQINPLRETVQVFPWRFLNPERASVLDIDIDIEGSKKESTIQALKNVYGEDRVAKVLTFSTEKSRSAILTAARGIGMDNDTASYIASLIVFDRGTPRSLKQMYYGDEDNKPVAEFVREMDAYPELWYAAQKIEGLCSGCGQHAGGVIIVDKPFTESTALMKAKSGDVITQFDLHDAEEVSLIKIDLLSIDALDKIHTTLNLLLKDKVIEWQGTIKDTYEKYIGVYTLERDAEDMWRMLWDHKVISFFQMEKESGKQAVALAKPHSVDDLAALNSVMRLMAQEKGGESPLAKYARFKNDISQWYTEMSSMGLGEEEQEILKEIVGSSYGICEAQELLFLLVMHPQIGGFSLAWADKLRKSVAKKSPKDFENLQREFLLNAQEKNLSNNLVQYVWFVLIFMQRGYGFNRSHTLAYSIIGLQEMNLNYKYNPIYWQTANLIVDSGAVDEESNDSTNYGKMAIAISTVQKEGVRVALPMVNEAEFGFKPDTKNNQIIFGFKGINGINTELSQLLIKNRPYESMDAFADMFLKEKTIKPSQMIQLIKGGCFTELHNPDRMITMDWYLRNYVFEPCNKLTLAQFKKLQELNIVPESIELAAKMVNFKKYVLDDEGLYEKHIDPGKKMVKRGYHDGYYILDQNSQPFFIEYFTEDSVVGIKGEFYLISEKKFTKEVDAKIQPLKDWMESDQALQAYNEALYQELWDKHASGTVPWWNMQALCYYDDEHELEHVNEKTYGIVNYFELPEEPEPYDFYTRHVNGEAKVVPKYKITRIAGTVISADNNHHMITLLTKYGAVNVKMNKGHYAFYNKRISKPREDDPSKKEVLEESWLKRGNKLLIAGIRRGDQFWPMVYKDTIYKHTINLVEEIYNDGTLLLSTERAQVN